MHRLNLEDRLADRCILAKNRLYMTLLGYGSSFDAVLPIPKPLICALEVEVDPSGQLFDKLSRPLDSIVLCEKLAQLSSLLLCLALKLKALAGLLDFLHLHSRHFLFFELIQGLMSLGVEG